MIQLSEITNSISPSLTRRLFNLAQKYDNVIDFTLGDPDIHPHDKIKEAGCKAILEGRTRYSPNAGLRAIDWERGNPYVWKMEDLQYLLETEHLFARKFDSQNMDVVIKIRELFS